MTAPLVIAILTLDEELNIAKAIRSVGSRAPVVVLDSGSRDRTRAIAEAMGAEVHQRAFDDYASQRNHAVALVRDRYRWIFFLDADEEMTTALWEEVERTLGSAVDGAFVRYSLRWLGHDLRHGGVGATRILRLVRSQVARFERPSNERLAEAGLRTTTLTARLRHADAKPISTWFHKHVRYAESEARQYLSAPRSVLARGIDPRTVRGRVAALRWAYDGAPLFLRPWLHFTRNVVVHAAWRDGVPGLVFAGMQALWYPMLIDLLIYEARLGEHPPCP